MGQWQADSIVQRLWLECINAFFKSYHIKENSEVLHFYAPPVYDTHTLLRDYTKKGKVTSYNIYDRHQITLEQKDICLPDNTYDLAFFSFNPDVIIYERLSRFTETIFKTLKPTGRFLFVFPTNKSVPRITLRKLINTGEFPEFDSQSFHIYDDTLNALKDILTQSAFSDAAFNTFHHEIALSDKYDFKQYLWQVSYLYKSIMSDEKREKIVEMQTCFFDELCQKHYQGKPIFHYEVNTVTAIK